MIITIHNISQEYKTLEYFTTKDVRWSTSVYATDFKPSLTEDFTGFPYTLTLINDQITYNATVN